MTTRHATTNPEILPHSWADQDMGRFVHEDGQSVLRMTHGQPRSLPPREPYHASSVSHSQTTAYAITAARPRHEALEWSSLYGDPRPRESHNPLQARGSERRSSQGDTTKSTEAGARNTVGVTPKERVTDPAALAGCNRVHRPIIGNRDASEPFYSTFKIHPPSFFRIGRVFHVLLSVAPGEIRTQGTNGDASGISPSDGDPCAMSGVHGERVHSQVRCFVVIRAGDRHCSALPVLTYGNRGVGEPGVSKHEHAIIYTTVNPPNPHPDERPRRDELPMRPQAIRVVPDDPAQKLDPLSRVDFARVQTTRHNIRARSFGMVHQDSMQALIVQFGNVILGSIGLTGAHAAIDEERRHYGLSGAAIVSQATKSRPVNNELDETNVDNDNDDDDDDEDDLDNEDEDDVDDGNVGVEGMGIIEPGLQATKIARDTSDNLQAAKAAINAIERLRGQGYTTDQSFAVLVAKLQSDRGLSRLAAHRLLRGWTRTAPTNGSSEASTEGTSQITDGPTSVPETTIRVC